MLNHLNRIIAVLLILCVITDYVRPMDMSGSTTLQLPGTNSIHAFNVQALAPAYDWARQFLLGRQLNARVMDQVPVGRWVWQRDRQVAAGKTTPKAYDRHAWWSEGRPSLAFGAAAYLLALGVTRNPMIAAGVFMTTASTLFVTGHLADFVLSWRYGFLSIAGNTTVALLIVKLTYSAVYILHHGADLWTVLLFSTFFLTIHKQINAALEGLGLRSVEVSKREGRSHHAVYPIAKLIFGAIFISWLAWLPSDPSLPPMVRSIDHLGKVVGTFEGGIVLLFIVLILLRHFTYTSIFDLWESFQQWRKLRIMAFKEHGIKSLRPSRGARDAWNSWERIAKKAGIQRFGKLFTMGNRATLIPLASAGEFGYRISVAATGKERRLRQWGEIHEDEEGPGGRELRGVIALSKTMRLEKQEEFFIPLVEAIQATSLSKRIEILRSLTTALPPEEQGAWSQWIHQAEIELSRFQIQGGRNRSQSFLLVRLLNERWFLPREYCIFSHPTGPVGDPTWQDFGIARVREQENRILNGHTVWLRRVNPIIFPKPFATAVNPNGYFNADEEVIYFFDRPEEDDGPDDLLHLRFLSRPLRQTLKKLFPDIQKRQNLLTADASLEEWRHALDNVRLESHPPQNRVEHVREYWDRLERDVREQLLRPSGRIAEDPWKIAPGQNAQIRTLTFFETSGLMTRAALSSQPLLTIGDSLDKLKASNGRIFYQHAMASVYTFWLLGLHYGVALSDSPILSLYVDPLTTWSFVSWKERIRRVAQFLAQWGLFLLARSVGKKLPDVDLDWIRLRKIERMLSSQTPASLRLALKAIYSQEFRYPVDEPPFAEILPDGSLRGRSGGIDPQEPPHAGGINNPASQYGPARQNPDMGRRQPEALGAA